LKHLKDTLKNQLPKNIKPASLEGPVIDSSKIKVDLEADLERKRNMPMMIDVE
jgi:hypothetical protein